MQLTIRRLITAAVVLIASVAVVQPFVATESPRVAAAGPDLLVGDSVMAGMNATARAGLGPHVFDAKVCRRLVARSCSYQGVRPISALSVIQANAGPRRAIVVAAGYNDSSLGSSVDTVVAEARRQGVQHVVWLTYRVAGRNAGWYREHNATLHTKAAQYAELRLADWASLSAGRSDWVAADGLHLNGSGARAMSGLIAGTLASLEPPPPPPPTRCDLAANGSALPGPAAAPTALPAGGVVLHDQPLRLVDTRGADDSKVRAGTTLRVPVPASRRAGTGPVVVTVTAVDPCAPGHLTAFACGTGYPATSTLNTDRPGAIANTSIVDVGDDGALCVAAAMTTDIVVDIIGHIAPDGDLIEAVTPRRLVDTRAGNPSELDLGDGPVTRRSTITIPVRRSAAVADADAGVVVNATVVGSDGPGHLTIGPGPCTDTLTASSLNHVTGEVIAAATFSRIGNDGTICISTHATTHLVVDLLATVGPDGHRLQPVQNARLVDSRESGDDTGQFAIPVVRAPDGHHGAIVNAVGIGDSDGFLSLRDCSERDDPEHSTLNHRSGQVRSNLGVVPSPDGCAFRLDRAHVVVDAVAWLVD